MRFAPTFLLLAIAALANGQRYRVTNLGTLGGNDSEAFGINANGGVVGYASTAPGPDHAFIYSAGVMHDLGTAGGAGGSLGNAINDTGHVAGQLLYANGTYHSFLYANGNMTAYNPLTAQGINDLDQVVGFDYLPNGYNVYAYLLHNGVVTNLGMPSGYTDAKAYGINASGEVVGTTWGAQGGGRAVVWSGGKIADLGDLGGGSAEAFAINASGQVVGDSYNAAGNEHAFLYSNGSLTDLGTLGGKLSTAASINAGGTVVGMSYVNSADFHHGFVYEYGAMQDLNALSDLGGTGITVMYANGINSRGYIAATGHATDYSALLLTPYWIDAPTAYQIAAGKYVSGNLASLASVDGNYLVIQSGPSFGNGSPPLSVVLTGTSTLASPTDVRMQLTGHADSVDLTETVEFYDYVASAWVLVDSTTATTSDSSFAAISTDPARFVQPGTNQMKARVSLKPSGPISKSPWSLYLDQAVWNVSP